jgi:hypothetical protein
VACILSSSLDMLYELPRLLEGSLVVKG